jgi:hypothetical protein
MERRPMPEYDLLNACSGRLASLGLASRIADLQTVADTVRAKRGAIDNASVTAAQTTQVLLAAECGAAGHYRFARCIEPSAGLAGQVSAYTAFLNAKESAGQERAILNAVIFADAFTKRTFEQAVSVVAAQNTYLHNFRKAAIPSHVSLYENTVTGPEHHGLR